MVHMFKDGSYVLDLIYLTLQICHISVLSYINFVIHRIYYLLGDRLMSQSPKTRIIKNSAD